jgi:hypothetical protein
MLEKTLQAQEGNTIPNRNALWMCRFNQVKSLVTWVRNNLKDIAPDYEEPTPNRRKPCRERRRTPVEKERKAEQYVMEHLSMGKMFYPLEKDDPLFTQKQYANDSLMSQLNSPGLYDEFQEQVWICLSRIKDRLTESDTISWDTATDGMDENTKKRIESWWNRTTESTDLEDQRLIGLILRYRCVGGFTSTMHGSVPAIWGQILPDFIECFASPLNHKFAQYHSLFDDDMEDFGCSGNFFRCVETNNGRLTPYKNYEINPPFANCIYDRIQSILEKTLLNRGPGSVDPKGMKILLIAPAWNDAGWMKGINDLLKQSDLHDGYAANSKTMNIPKGEIHYVQDMSSAQFSCDTVAWFFSPTPIQPVNLLETLFESD